MRLSRAITAALTLLLALCSLNFLWLDSVWLWKLSVLTTQCGHLIALLPLGLAVVVLFNRGLRTRRMTAIQLLMAAAASAGFAAPLAHYLKNASTSIDFSELWIGRTEATVPFQRKTYKPGLTLDYYPPQNQKNQAQSAPKNAPWILVVHGGGWDSGNSEQTPELNSHLANLGYGVVAINYRLAPAHPWPAQREDLLAALRYVRAQISEYPEEWPLAADQWITLGRSAGGQLAAQLAYSLREIPKPKATILFYAPTDLFFGYEAGAENDILGSRGLLRRFLGSSPYESPATYDNASPLRFVDLDSAAATRAGVPTLLFHGTRDTLAWVKHSERLHERLRLKKIPSEFYPMEYAPHGFDYFFNGPAAQFSTRKIEEFLKKYCGI